MRKCKLHSSYLIVSASINRRLSSLARDEPEILTDTCRDGIKPPTLVMLIPNPLQRKRILLVSPSPPFPPDNGAKQRTYLLWKALSEIAPVDVILCEDISFDSSVTAASIPASINFLGSFPWQSKGHSLYRLFTKSTPSLAVERLLRVALPRHWDYDVDRRVNQSLSDLLGRNQYFLAVGRYLKPIVKTGLVGRMPCVLDIDDVDFDIFAQRAQDVTLPRWQRLLYSAHSLQIEAAFKKWLPQFHGLWVAKAGDTRYEVTRNAAILPNIPYNVPVVRSSTERFEIGKSHPSHRRSSQLPTQSRRSRSIHSRGMAKGPSSLSDGGVLAGGEERSGVGRALASGPWRQGPGIC